MRPPSFPATNRFAYELELEISSALTFSAGELGALALDGLFSLDGEGRLFPGITSPDAGNRLIGVQIGAIGYERRGTAAPIGDRYRRLVLKPRGRITKATRDLGDRLEQAVDTVSEGLIHQRMLIAKLSGLADKCRHRGAVTDADRTIAEALLTSAETLERTIESSVGLCCDQLQRIDARGLTNNLAYFGIERRQPRAVTGKAIRRSLIDRHSRFEGW